jgi:hypothetical protein
MTINYLIQKKIMQDKELTKKLANIALTYPHKEEKLFCPERGHCECIAEFAASTKFKPFLVLVSISIIPAKWRGN